MGLFNDILDEIMDTIKGSMSDKAKQLINQGKMKKKLNNIEDELDEYLRENYGNEIFFYSLDRYIHNGKVNLDTEGNDITSAFYYTLICAFLCSVDKYLGKDRFFEYHWTRILERYPNVQYDKNNIKKCFMHYYNTFKEEFICLSDTDVSLVNALKETSNENSDNLMKKIADEGDSIKGTIKGIEEILKHGNAERDTQPEKEDKICDHNNEYQERLNDTLFLESDFDDGKKASLADLYIEPHIKLNFKNLKQWTENRDSRILLIYGKAGIGKTSFTSWLSLYNDFKQGCHILELRQCIPTLDSGSPWESIKKSFKCMNDDEYQNKVLILDGLDEVCVLKNNFDGHEFINKLSITLKSGIGRNIRIIIASRMGYFSNIERNNNVNVGTIFWAEDSVIDWCKAYCTIHNDRIDWCESFKKTYASLKPYDKRKDVFCTPLILYICCFFQIDISKHNSIASIYDEAFNVIGTRRYNELIQDAKVEFEVNRQFTKELAFQMFLNDKLEDILSSDFVQIAKEKVLWWVQEKRSYHVKELEFEKLFAINHFAYGKKDAIEFAHKTIGEYFTALKLYEDYFEQIDGKAEDIWLNFFNAFRYKAIPSDIIQYLVDLILKRKDANWIETFFRAYYIGIENQSLFASAFFKPEYSTSCTALIKQIQMTFRNLTWLLTGLGFDNSQFDDTNYNVQILASYFYGDINVSGWKNLGLLVFERVCLAKANLSSIILEGGVFYEAIFESVNFRNAVLNGANFEEANLSGSDLEGADLEGADLTRAHLNGAHLNWAHLEGAYLNGAHLINADLKGAYLDGAHFTKAELKGADFEGAHLEKADFERADLEGVTLKCANLKRANLQLAYLKGADIKEADFEGAHLERADFEGAHLERADFEGAHLEEAHLEVVHLEGAHFEGAHLERVHLEKAHLEGAHLEGAHLEGAHLEGAHLEGAYLEGAYLKEAHLEGAHLKSAHLKGAHFEGAHLTRADLKEEELQGVYLGS